MAARGLENNNPLNIRKGSRWVGLRPSQPDPEFCTFASILYGLRAGFMILRRYVQVYHLKTIAEILHRWAPTSENKTQFYIEYVCKGLGCEPNDIVKLDDKLNMCLMVSLMCYYECGKRIDMQLIVDAYDMVFE